MAEAGRREDWPRTVADFEAWHARQPERWEFIAGWPRMMAPGSMNHSLIKANLFAALRAALAGTPCRAHVDGPQILTDEISAIPDVVVSCAPIDHSTPMIAQPALIAEVMSPSSEGDDTTRKWFAYRKIPSLRHYLVLSQEQREVQVHSRAGDLWHERFVAEGALELDDPPLRLELADLYAETDIAA
jgi:Uma2 family endonuclease